MSKKPVKNEKKSKRVRVTLELDGQFLRLLEANLRLDSRTASWLTEQNKDRAELDPSHVLALLVLLDGRGALPTAIEASTPDMWRDTLRVICGERRVYQDGELIAGPDLGPKPK